MINTYKDIVKEILGRYQNFDGTVSIRMQLLVLRGIIKEMDELEKQSKYIDFTGDI